MGKRVRPIYPLAGRRDRRLDGQQHSQVPGKDAMHHHVAKTDGRNGGEAIPKRFREGRILWFPKPDCAGAQSHKTQKTVNNPVCPRRSQDTAQNPNLLQSFRLAFSAHSIALSMRGIRMLCRQPTFASGVYSCFAAAFSGKMINTFFLRIFYHIMLRVVHCIFDRFSSQAIIFFLFFSWSAVQKRGS